MWMLLSEFKKEVSHADKKKFAAEVATSFLNNEKKYCWILTKHRLVIIYSFIVQIICSIILFYVLDPRWVFLGTLAKRGTSNSLILPGQGWSGQDLSFFESLRAMLMETLWIFSFLLNIYILLKSFYLYESFGIGTF